MELLITRYDYETVTDEDTEDIDEELTDEDTYTMSVREFIIDVLRFAEPSTWPLTAKTAHKNLWYTVYHGQNYMTGEYERSSYFVKHASGKDITPRQHVRMWNAAQNTKRIR